MRSLANQWLRRAPLVLEPNLVLDRDVEVRAWRQTLERSDLGRFASASAPAPHTRRLAMQTASFTPLPKHYWQDGPANEVYSAPKSDYTKALMRAAAGESAPTSSG